MFLLYDLLKKKKKQEPDESIAGKKKLFSYGLCIRYGIYLLLISKVHSSYHIWWNGIGLPLLLLTSHISITFRRNFRFNSFYQFCLYWLLCCLIYATKRYTIHDFFFLLLLQFFFSYFPFIHSGFVILKRTLDVYVGKQNLNNVSSKRKKKFNSIFSRFGIKFQSIGKIFSSL